jgi:hypothetical protein
MTNKPNSNTQPAHDREIAPEQQPISPRKALWGVVWW